MRRCKAHVKAIRTMTRHDEEREKRLAEALRANLRRRKAQARGDAPLPSHPAPRDGALDPLGNGEGEE